MGHAEKVQNYAGVIYGLSLSFRQVISHAVSNFYGTEIKIWAGFRPVGNTEKSKLLRLFFSYFQGQKKS